MTIGTGPRVRSARLLSARQLWTDQGLECPDTCSTSHLPEHGNHHSRRRRSGKFEATAQPVMDTHRRHNHEGTDTDAGSERGHRARLSVPDNTSYCREDRQLAR